MLVSRFIPILAGFSCILAALIHPDVKRDLNLPSDNGVQRKYLLTNAERLAKGMLPAVPKALENVLATRTSVDGTLSYKKRQGACPSMAPIIFPPHPPAPNIPIGWEEDDWAARGIYMEFPFVIGSQSRQLLWIGQNGFVQFDSHEENTGQDRIPFPTTRLSPHAVAPFWEELSVRGNDEISSYAFTSNSLSIRWRSHLVNEPNELIDLTLHYTTNSPGIWFVYYDVVPSQASEHSQIIGYQDEDRYTTYRYRDPNAIHAGLVLAIDTNCSGRYATMG